MSKQTRWLFTEIERWTKEQLISSDQAVRLRALYPDTGPRVSWGLILFSGLGAVVVGLGIILLLAYNWDDIPKFGKLSLIFGSIVAAHVAGLWLRWKRGAQPEIGEALSLLGTMLFGAGIWLVAQVYHIDEHFPNGFLIWGLGALALAWALNSVPQAILAAATLTVWGSCEVLQFDAPIDWSSALILVGLAPLAWRKRSRILTAVLLTSSYFLILANAGYWSGGGGAFTTAFSLSALLIAGARLIEGMSTSDDDGIAHVMTFFGLAGFAVCSYILSFHEMISDVLRWSNDHDRSAVGFIVYRWALFTVAVVAWGGLLAKTWRNKQLRVSNEEWLCPIALIYCQGLAVTGYYSDARFIAIVFNLVCLGVATMWMVRGCREGRLRPTVLGSLFFAALVFARYFDLFESLATRGVVFLVLGGVLFAEGFYYRRLRHERDGGELS